MKITTVPCGLLSANMYVVDNGAGQAIVIDPIDVDALTKCIDTASLSICGVFLTHAHFDHCADLEKIKDLTGAPTYMMKEDCGFLKDPYKNASYLIGQPQYLGSCDHLLSDGDTIEISGFTVHVMHTPGHTPGSCCFLVDNALFSGDTVFAGGIGRCDLYGGDPLVMRSSLEKLLIIQKDYHLYPGHGKKSTLFKEKQNLRYYL